MPDATTLDLHGKTWIEAQTAFVDFYNGAMGRAGGNSPGRLDVIHGYGSTGEGGVLRDRLRAYLARNADYLQFTAGEHLDGNPGHTLVVPLRPLAGLEQEILAYCAEPRAVTKITGKFRRHGLPEVRRVLASLEKQKRVEVVRKGALKMYRAV